MTEHCEATGELRGHKAFYSDSGALQLSYNEWDRQTNVIHECGPLCACPQDCPNRQLQHGVRRKLVRSRAAPPPLPPP